MMNSNIKNNLFLQIIIGAMLAIALLWFYWSVLTNLAYQLSTNEDYSFGLLLPLVSAYITYMKWPQIRSQRWNPSWLGLIIMAMGFGLYVMGELIGVFYLPVISFLVNLIGLLVLMGGWKILRFLAFPILLLFLMVPLPAVIMKNLTFPLQIVSSNLAAGLLQLLGIPLVRHGNVIDLGVRQLQVVAACSGLRYIMSLTALGIIYCYFYQRRTWKVAVLIISLVPAAIFANALRVAAMGIFPALQEGFWHSFSGWLIFVFCFAFLALNNWLLNYLQPPVSVTPSQELPLTAASPIESHLPALTPYLMAALTLVLVAEPIALKLSKAPIVSLRQDFNAFPLIVGPWHGRRGFLDADMIKQVGADNYLEVAYTNPQGAMVSLWVAFYQSQTKEIAATIHSPAVCLTGAGWKTLESKVVEVAPGLHVKYLLMEQGGNRQLVYYWYLQRGRWLTNEFDSKLYMVFDGLVRRRSDGTLIRLITPAGPDLAQARERLTAFANLLVPLLPQFIPE
jgi:exosortase D (VPLPA-CTERM-specific)